MRVGGRFHAIALDTSANHVAAKIRTSTQKQFVVVTGGHGYSYGGRDRKRQEDESVVGRTAWKTGDQDKVLQFWDLRSTIRACCKPDKSIQVQLPLKGSQLCLMKEPVEKDE